MTLAEYDNTLALAVSEQRYRRLFEAAQDGILILNADNGRIEDVNPYLCRLLGYEASELVGLKRWEIGAFIDQRRWLNSFKELQEKNYVHYDDMPLRTKGGEVIDVEIISNVYDVGDTRVIQCNIRNISDRKRAERLQVAYDQSVSVGLNGIVEALTSALEMRDPYTAGHAKRVAELSVAIGRELHCDATALEGLRVCALVHDIGKIAIPAELLTKPTPLTVWEMALVRSHVEVGYGVLRTIDFPWPVGETVLQHHERLDGSGYPGGLKGEAISREARVLAVADTVEAMTTNRPYRFAKGLEAALAVIAEGRGTLFDPDVVDACQTLFQQKGYAFHESLPRQAITAA